MKNKKYTEQELKDAVKTSTSYRQVLSKLQLKEAGGNYECLKKAISELKLDISHFTGKGWNKNKITGPKRKVSEYLSGTYPIQSHKLKLRLIAEGIFIRQCYKCHRNSWEGQPIPLELEHINGDHLDNSLDNLTLLCPNCHAQTQTYRGKNKKKA